MGHKRTAITLAGLNRADKIVEAIVLSPRVAVAESYEGYGYSITDPKTGCAYWYGHHSTEAQALRLARSLMRKFGRDPLRGSIFDKEAHRWIRKPRKASELRQFAMKRDL